MYTFCINVERFVFLSLGLSNHVIYFHSVSISVNIFRCDISIYKSFVKILFHIEREQIGISQ